VCEDGDVSIGIFKDDMEIGIKHWSLAGRRRCGICGEWQWQLHNQEPTLNFNFQSGTIMGPIFQNMTDDGRDVLKYKQRLIAPAVLAFKRACGEFTNYRYEDVDENILLGRYPPTQARKRILCRRHVDVADITSMLNVVFVERELPNTWRAWCSDERVCNEGETLPTKPDVIEQKNPIRHLNKALDSGLSGTVPPSVLWPNRPRDDEGVQAHHVLLGIVSVSGVVAAAMLAIVAKRRHAYDPFTQI
jgi:hypothetical protein